MGCVSGHNALGKVTSTNAQCVVCFLHNPELHIPLCSDAQCVVHFEV